ncbi:Uncharacterized protein FWK35_00033976, partial [Aphis craccivora]
ESALKAIDICFKSFFVFNLHYTPQCEQIWYFIQTFIYEITTKFDKNCSPNVTTLINDLNKFLNIIEYKCIEPSCGRSYNSFDSFSRHLLTHTLVNQESFSNLHIEPTQIDDILNQQSNEQLEISSCSNISIKAFKNLVTEDGIMLISKWYNEAVVPRNKLQILINDLNGFNDKCMQILKKEVLDNLKKNNSDENSIIMFDVINDPFQNLKTEYKRLKVLEELGVYVKPIEITIVNVNICFIPLRCIFKVFFEQPNVLKTVLEYFKRLNSMTGGIVCSFVQSEVW